MASFGDFSSLLQLGVGTGVGLSLFRAPVDLRVHQIEKIIDRELVTLQGASTDFARKKRIAIQDIRYRLSIEEDRLDKAILPFMILALMGALLNLFVLADATLNADIQLSNAACAWLLFVSVGWFLLEIVALEFIARKSLDAISKDLVKTRRLRSPP